MDILGHTLYGMTLCSRSGFAGGRAGSLARAHRDWTVWAAAAFSLLPDMASIGIHFGHMLLSGREPSFHAIPAYVFTFYNVTHSLIIASACSLLLLEIRTPLALPSFAWSVHVLMDALLHGSGRWQTPIFFPLSSWHFPGVNWWEHPWIGISYAALLPVLWFALHLWRRKRPVTPQRL